MQQLDTWVVGSPTQFNIDSQTYLGLDVAYQVLNSATGSNAAGTGVVVAAGGTQPSALRTLSDQSAWMVEFRVHRNFYP